MIRIRIGKFSIDYDRKYGVGMKSGWSIAWDGSYLVQLEKSFVVAIVNAIRRNRKRMQPRQIAIDDSPLKSSASKIDDMTILDAIRSLSAIGETHIADKLIETDGMDKNSIYASGHILNHYGLITIGNEMLAICGERKHFWAVFTQDGIPGKRRYYMSSFSVSIDDVQDEIDFLFPNKKRTVIDIEMIDEVGRGK